MNLTNKNDFDFYDYFNDFFYPNTFSSKSNIMKTDISLRKDNYVFDIEMPGYLKEDIKAELNNGYLNVWVTNNKTSDVENEEYKCLHKERFRGEASRSFYVGCKDDTQVNATYHNGILTVVIPKYKEQKEEKQYINIQ